MLKPEKLDYFKWKIPPGDRIRLTLIQEDDLKFVHDWKSQIDISYITAKAIQHISLAERYQRFKEGIPSILSNSTSQQLFF
jgi:[ribosomal protein S5]-alanine N-acetyltransferase